MGKKYKEMLLYNIYAIIEPDTDAVYVGKTTINNPYSKRKYIINGGISSIDGEFSENCKFVLLESVYVSKEDAFRHILSWYRFFEDNGYDVLVKDKAAHMLEFPKERTEKIYNEICLPYSVKEVLERKVLPLNVAEETEDIQTEQHPFTQLNIRVRENVAESFRAVSRNFGLSQNDTLKLLLLGKDDAMKTSIADEICILKQKARNYKELLEQQRRQDSAKMNRALKKHKEKIKTLESSINLLVKFLGNVRAEQIKPQYIKEEYGNKLFHSYSYPETSGCCLARLEEIVNGKYRTSERGTVTSAKFLLFNTMDDKKIKLRFYAQGGFIGRSPISCAYKGSLWIIGYTISDDGAANIVSGIPIDYIYKELPEENILEEKMSYSSVDDLISAAQNIRKNIW